MQVIVIIFNVTLACCCLAVARWIWAFRLSLHRTTQALVVADMFAHETLRDAPSQIIHGQLNIQQWNQFLSQLEPTIEQGKALLRWVQLSQAIGTIIWRQRWTMRYHHRKY